MSRTSFLEPNTDVRESKLGVMLSTAYLAQFTCPTEGLMFRRSMSVKPYFSNISWSGKEDPISIEFKSSRGYLNSAAF